MSYQVINYIVRVPFQLYIYNEKNKRRLRALLGSKEQVISEGWDLPRLKALVEWVKSIFERLEDPYRHLGL